MTLLAIVPTARELGYFDGVLRELSDQPIADTVGVLPVTRYPELSLVTAMGGLGKTQFAVHTQHLIENGDWELVVCAGAAGGLVDEVAIRDVVIATETVEHDLRPYMKPRMPRFPAKSEHLDWCRAALREEWYFPVHFGAVASGDEDIVYEERRNEIRERTGAIAVAWEGAGGARACALRDTPFIEIRGISDNADTTSIDEFSKNLPFVIRNVVSVVVAVARSRN